MLLTKRSKLNSFKCSDVVILVAVEIATYKMNLLEILQLTPCIQLLTYKTLKHFVVSMVEK